MVIHFTIITIILKQHITFIALICDAFHNFKNVEYNENEKFILKYL